MSRAFVKDDVPDGPMMVPPRPPLPAGVPNYVTRRGRLLLRDERAALESERKALKATRMDETERGRKLTWLASRIADLDDRIASARLIELRAPYPDAVRFGATVSVRNLDGPDEARVFLIVGVDEADAETGRIAFTSPIARALTGKAVGDRVLLRTPAGEEPLEIIAIGYE